MKIMKITFNKFTIILISITAIILLLSTAVFIKYFPQKQLSQEEQIKNITKNTKLMDINTDHNQVLDVDEYAKKHNLQIPSILINFDTHSDIFLNRPVNKIKGAGVEDWINEFLIKNPNISEVYWVMPKEEILVPFLFLGFFENKDNALTTDGSPLFGNSIKNNIEYKSIFTPIILIPYTQNFLLDPKTGKLNEYDKNNKLTKNLFNQQVKYRPIKIITCTENSLPDFKDKKVFLSIDADYISNSGFDTIDDFTNNKNPDEIKTALNSLVNTLHKKNIIPEIISMSLSPMYLPEEDQPQMTDFFKYVIKTAGKSDNIKTYTREYY